MKTGALFGPCCIVMGLMSATVLTASTSVEALPDTLVVPDVFVSERGLNEAVESATSAGTLSNTVFQLVPYGQYVLDSAITVPAGERLTIIGPEPGKTQQTAPAQIRWSSKPGINTNHIFRCFGDIYLKNVWLLYAKSDGQQSFSNVQIEDSPDTLNGQVADFENVIFDYSATPYDGSGAVGIRARHFRGTFRNCYFRNCIDSHYRYYGRALSFPFASGGWHSDSVLFENCTFANIGYVYEQESGNYADVVRFNHCTFMNTMMYTLESGWWRRLSVTNSVFVNTHMHGYIPAFDRYTPIHSGGTILIDSVSAFGFEVPFTDQERQILFSHSSYFIEDWLRDWMVTAEGEIYFPDSTVAPGDLRPHPQPMLNAPTLSFFDTREVGAKAFPFMNRASLYDSTDPGFVLPPTDVDAIKRFLWIKWYGGGEDTVWAFHRQDAFDQLWPLREDLSYTNTGLMTAGMGAFPLGDLYRWFPEMYAVWKEQSSEEYARIDAWLDTGVDPDGPVGVNDGPTRPATPVYSLSQNYPNPFNPETRILYTLPRTAHVSLKVYDVLGKQVATLFDGEQTPGTHTALFRGGRLPGGVYFCRMRVGSFSGTNKLVLMK